MKVSWPPTEETGWRITSLQTNNKTIFFPVLPLEQAYFAIRFGTNEPVQLELKTLRSKSFLFEAQPNEWTLFPYCIESHTLGTFWDTLDVSIDCTVEIASFQWNLRQYRMRVLLNEDGYMICAYKYNKKGHLMSMMAYEGQPYKASEDGYILLPNQLKSSAELFPQGRVFSTKKLPDEGYFPWRKNGLQEKTAYE
jgi:hypothetical protein